MMKVSDQPSIAVIIVVLNGEKTLKRAIESVIHQTYANCQLIIVDGGSTDSTLEIIQPYVSRTSYFNSQKDNGIYDAMNHALGQCKADWCLFIGCDDVLVDCLHLVAQKLTDTRSVYYGNVFWRSNGSKCCGRFSKFKLIYRNICHQAIFYPRACFDKEYDTAYRYLADYKYNIELWGAGVKFNYLDMIIADYNDLGLSSAGDAKFWKIKARLLSENLGVWTGALCRFVDLFAPLYRRIKRVRNRGVLQGPESSAR